MSGAPRVYIGNLQPGTDERDIQDEFARFGRIKSLWVARNPAGFAFLEYEDPRDSDDAISKMNGHRGWRVDLSKGRGGPRGGRGGGGDRYNDRGRSPPRRRSLSPGRRRRSPSYERRRRSPSGGRSRSRSPRGRRASPPRGSARSPPPRHNSPPPARSPPRYRSRSR